MNQNQKQILIKILREHACFYKIKDGLWSLQLDVYVKNPETIKTIKELFKDEEEYENGNDPDNLPLR